MYFPFLRGRQSELLAIRTLLKESLLSNKIIPVIEPIKPTATLRKTLEEFIKHEHKLYIVSNPQVGNFNAEIENTPEEDDEFIELINKDQFNKVMFVRDREGVNKDNDAYILVNKDHLEWYMEENTEDTNTLFIPDSTEFRRRLRHERKRILQGDYFEPENRNADYLELPSRPFSSDHLHFMSEGYYGFSDYSIVGSSFMEGGFAPRAVAIHMVYFTDNYNLRIKHFTSESNEDITNPAGKFHEALAKLVNAFEGDDINETLGLRKFREHYDNGTYPGLGSVKQLSIMHHIELMADYLGRENE